MKVCKFCGSTCREEVGTCPGCGGAEFSHKCGNCGTTYDQGNFCPVCGVKAGTPPKRCPRCGNEFYTNACPNCGFVGYPHQGTSTYAPPVNAPAQQPPQKKKYGVWMWILMILFFPITLTVVILKNKTMKVSTKVILLVALWLFVLIVGAAQPAQEPVSDTEPFPTGYATEPMPTDAPEPTVVPTEPIS